MVMVYISLYLCLLLSLIAIGALLICALIEAIKERHKKTKDTETEYYDRLWKEFQRENRAICKTRRLERKQTRKTDRERKRKRRIYEREERLFKRAFSHIDKGWAQSTTETN